MFRTTNSFLLLCISFLVVLQVMGKPTQKPKFTLDPDTLAEVHELLKATSESSKNHKYDIMFRLGNNEKIIFELKAPSELPSLNLTKQLSTTTGHIKSGDHKCSNSRERYHLATMKCYTPGKSGGPCDANMLFYAHADNKVYGDCDCNYNADIPLVFHPQTGKCYPIYEQAYCGKNQWLVFDESETAVCEERKCAPSSVTQSQIVYFNNRCVEFDKWDKDCKNSYETIIFKPDGLQPVCAEAPVSEQSNFNIPKLKCKSGTSLDTKGNCRQKIKFNIDG